MESLDRRTSTSRGVDFEYAESVLAVGARTAVLDDVSDRSEVLRTYFDLVAEQRSAPLASRVDLRDRDLVSLASILDLPPVELERYIERELTRFIEAATASAAVATAEPKAMRKFRIGLLMLGAATAAATGATVVARVTANAQPTPVVPVATPSTAPSGATVRVEPNPNGTGTFVITDTPPVPAQADGTEIGGAEQVDPRPPGRSPR